MVECWYSYFDVKGSIRAVTLLILQDFHRPLNNS